VGKLTQVAPFILSPVLKVHTGICGKGYSAFAGGSVGSTPLLPCTLYNFSTFHNTFQHIIANCHAGDVPHKINLLQNRFPRKRNHAAPYIYIAADIIVNKWFEWFIILIEPCIIGDIVLRSLPHVDPSFVFLSE